MRLFYKRPIKLLQHGTRLFIGYGPKPIHHQSIILGPIEKHAEGDKLATSYQLFHFVAEFNAVIHRYCRSLRIAEQASFIAFSSFALEPDKSKSPFTRNTETSFFEYLKIVIGTPCSLLPV